MPKYIKRDWAREDKQKADNAKADSSLSKQLPSIKIVGRFADSNVQRLDGEI
jgi:hypothetical protein